jgi:hypothetical protein
MSSEPVNGPLSPSQQDRFGKLEQVIERSLDSGLDLGEALLEIQEQRLYRGTPMQTFEAYVEKSWSLKRATAYDYVKAARTRRNVRTSGHDVDLKYGQLVEIGTLPREKQLEVATKVVGLSVRDTRRVVRKYRKQMERDPRPIPGQQPLPLSQEMTDTSPSLTVHGPTRHDARDRVKHDTQAVNDALLEAIRGLSEQLGALDLNHIRERLSEPKLEDLLVAIGTAREALERLAAAISVGVEPFAD